jgi:hypothetical protein
MRRCAQRKGVSVFETGIRVMSWLWLRMCQYGFEGLVQVRSNSHRLEHLLDTLAYQGEASETASSTGLKTDQSACLNEFQRFDTLAIRLASLSGWIRRWNRPWLLCW